MEAAQFVRVDEEREVRGCVGNVCGVAVAVDSFDSDGLAEQYLVD